MMVMEVSLTTRSVAVDTLVLSDVSRRGCQLNAVEGIDHIITVVVENVCQDKRNQIAQNSKLQSGLPLSQRGAVTRFFVKV